MQKHISALLLLGGLLAAGISACGSNTGAPNVKQSARNTNSAANKNNSPASSIDTGAKLFASSCESCHGKNGAGTSQGPKLEASPTVAARFGTETALATFIDHNMPATDPGSLSAGQYSLVSAYVWSLIKK
jgi:mono/diheme cytochrome c family protein